MIGTSSILDMKLPHDMRIFLNGMKHTKDLYVEDNNILISRSGTVGTNTLCGSSYEGCNTRCIIRVSWIGGQNKRL